jgi:hypothetical protein
MSLHEAPVAKGSLWAGRVATALPALFLLLDGVAKLFKPAAVIEATTQLGYAENVIVPIGIVLVVCTLLYLIPKTSVVGAILVTGFLGGAVATHVRAGTGVFPIVFPVILGSLLWLGLYLRNPSLRLLVPLTSV